MARFVPITAALAALLIVPGCTSDTHEQAARDTAARLAVALSDRDLTGVPIEDSQAAQKELRAVLAGAASLPAQVSVDSVEVDGDSATAMLTWSWATSGTNWSYPTAAPLVWNGEFWQAQWAPSIVEGSLRPGEVLRVGREQGRRGDILGAEGQPLVTYRPVVRYGIDKGQLTATQAGRSAARLAKLVGVDPADYRKLVTQAGNKAFVPAIVYRAGAASVISQSDLADIPGAAAIKDEVPLAPTREFAAQILGRVGPATAELVEESAGTIKAGDDVGLSGLQARYEQQLGGTPGTTVTAVLADQRRTLFQSEPVAGTALRTTLDLQAQQAADTTLAQVGPDSALVALRPSTGDILAAASGPGSAGRNTATAGRMPPGSTFKVVTALALLRAGLTPQDKVDCAAELVVDGKPFTNYSGYPASGQGEITLARALAYSCNTAVISQRGKIDSSDLSSAAAALGLGVDHDLGFPAYFGQVPAAQSQTAEAAAMIGQGQVLASPMAMAAVAASVKRGAVVVPRLLPDFEPAAPTAQPPSSAGPVPTGAPRHPLTKDEARDLRALMRGVVTGGTARFLADLPGPPVAAKTGTAEFGTRTPPQTHAWMIAYQGDLAVAVFVAEGESGSQTAGPLLTRFLRDVK